MFTQKSSSRFTKLGDAATFLFVSAVFIVGGFLISRHVSLAAPLLMLMTLLALSMLVTRLLMFHVARTQHVEEPVLVEVPVVEWKQVVGKDGEVVEVGYLKKRRTDAG